VLDIISFKLQTEGNGVEGIIGESEDGGWWWLFEKSFRHNFGCEGHD